MLQTGDIVLIRHKKIHLRKALHRVYQCYWDHVALIIFPKDESNGYESHILIESIQHGLNSTWKKGVEVHRLEKYLKHPDRYDIGIKRMKHIDTRIQERVRSFMLLNVDTPYYPLSTFKLTLASIWEPYKQSFVERQRYSCSSLIQKAFYEAVDWKERPLITFKTESGLSPIEIQELTTPKDIARSPVCSWIWNKHP